MKEDMSLSNLGTVALHAAKVPTNVFSSTLICILTLDYYACLKIVNNKTKMNKTCVSSHRCLGSPVVRKKEFRLKGFISLEEINLSRQKTKLWIIFV